MGAALAPVPKSNWREFKNHHMQNGETTRSGRQTEQTAYRLADSTAAVDAGLQAWGRTYIRSGFVAHDRQSANQ